MKLEFSIKSNSGNRCKSEKEKTYCWATRQKMDVQTWQQDFWHDKRLFRLEPVHTTNNPVCVFLHRHLCGLKDAFILIFLGVWLSFQSENLPNSWSYWLLAVTEGCDSWCYVLLTCKTARSFLSRYNLCLLSASSTTRKKSTDRIWFLSHICTAKSFWSYSGGPQ